MQGVRLRDDDELRGGPGGHPVPQRLHPRQQGAAGLIQDQQQEVLDQWMSVPTDIS